jgi:nucleoredoxin
MTSLVKKLGNTLVGKSGNIDTEQALSNKDIIGLYFSAHWCPPCRGFTPVLGEKYNELKAAGKSIEIVFVSSDRDESAFNDYHGSMPFMALPYSKRDLKESLSNEFGVRGIPTLVLLDGRTGEVITTKGRNAFSSDNVVAEYPFDNYRPLFGKGASLLDQLGETLVGQNGNVDTKTALAGKDAIGIYFSAHWCPPCRGFTPVLGQKYNELKRAGKNFELVFVSSDRDQSAFNEYHASMPFLALPYSDRTRKEQLSDFYNVSGIPTLVIVGADGAIINKNARGALSADTVVQDYPFHPKPMNDLSESLDGINEKTALVVLMEEASTDVKADVSAMLLTIATTERKKPETERRAQVFFTGCGGGPVGRVRSGCGLPSASANSAPTMVILDLNSRGAVYKPAPEHSNVTAANIEAFLDAFKAGTLDRSQFS